MSKRAFRARPRAVEPAYPERCRLQARDDAVGLLASGIDEALDGVENNEGAQPLQFDFPPADQPDPSDFEPSRNDELDFQGAPVMPNDDQLESSDDEPWWSDDLDMMEGDPVMPNEYDPGFDDSPVGPLEPLESLDPLELEPQVKPGDLEALNLCAMPSNSDDDEEK